MAYTLNLDTEYDFCPEKNRKLKEERGISFDEIIFLIGSGCLVDTIKHPNNERYPGQEIFVVRAYEYVYLIPFVETDNRIFLKTIFKSRKAAKKYLIIGENHEAK